MAASNKSKEEEYTDTSSDSILADEWQELSKSTYAKVIFSDLLHNPVSGNVGCKFQITDNVHEDPCDYVGLYRIGYENLSQCLASKMLSQAKCEDDGKLQSCVFEAHELPALEDGYYQFLYVTRDKEVCGASMPFVIRHPESQPREDSSDYDVVDEKIEYDVVAEKAEDDFLIVRSGLESKNRKLLDVMGKYLKRIDEMTSQVETLSKSKETMCQEKDDSIAYLQNQMELLESRNADQQLVISELNNTNQAMRKRIESFEISTEKFLDENNGLLESEEKLRRENIRLTKEVSKYQQLYRENLEALDKLGTVDPEKRILTEQVEDQMYMIKALEDSKQLALKEMSELSQSLSKRTHVLNQTRSELASCRGQLKDASMNQEKQDIEINRLRKELNDLMQLLGEKEDTVTKQSLKIKELEKNVEKLLRKQKKTKSDPMCLEKTAASLLEETTQRVEELLSLVEKLAEAVDFSNETEKNRFYETKIQLLIALSKMRKPQGESTANDKSNKTAEKILSSVLDSPAHSISSSDSSVTVPASSASSNLSTSKEESIVVSLPSSKIKYLGPNSKSSPKSKPSPKSKQSSSKQSSKNSYQSFQKDLDLEKVFDEELTPVENALQLGNIPRKIHKTRLNIISELNAAHIRNLETEDIAVVNRLTERINKRNPGYLLPVEEISQEDSGSEADCESDVTEDKKSKVSSMKNDLLCLERITEALREYLYSTKNLPCLIVGYDMAYAVLPPKKRTDLLLEECKKQYQIEILLEHIERQKEDMKKLSGRICDLLTRCMMWKDEVFELKAQRDELQIDTTKNEAEISKLKEECTKKDTIISFLSSEKLKLMKSEESYQDTINEHAARIYEAADLYKKQFVEIKKLKKRLRRYEQPISMISSRESSVGSESTKDSSFEVMSSQLLRNVSDSDTGEHVLANAVAALSEGMKHHNKTVSMGAKPKTRNNPVPDSSYSPAIDNSTNFAVDSSERKINLTNSMTERADIKTTTPNNVTTIQPMSSGVVVTETSVTKPTSANTTTESISDSDTFATTTEVPAKSLVSRATNEEFERLKNEDIKMFQKLINEQLSVISNTSSSEKIPEESWTLPCIFCDKEFSVSRQSSLDMIDHLKEEHQITMCPVCGQLFEAAVPERYLIYHVENHLKSM